MKGGFVNTILTNKQIERIQKQLQKIVGDKSFVITIEGHGCYRYQFDETCETGGYFSFDQTKFFTGEEIRQLEFATCEWKTKLLEQAKANT